MYIKHVHVTYKAEIDFPTTLALIWFSTINIVDIHVYL